MSKIRSCDSSRRKLPLHSNEAGAAMVEFAFSASAFLLFIVVIFEVGIIGWRTVTAQYIASMTVREAALFAGEEAGGANVTTVRNYGRNMAENFGLNIDQVTWDANFQVCPLINIGALNGPQAGNCIVPGGGYPEGFFGGPEDFISVTVVIPSRFFLQTMPINVTGWAAARNEEFGS